MDEYIDKALLYEQVVEKEEYLREVLLKTPYDTHEYDICLGRLTEIIQMKFLIADTPPSDVEPVVHAEWLHLEENKYKCTRCLEVTEVDEVMCEPVYLGCPYCRAKMDLGD